MDERPHPLGHRGDAAGEHFGQRRFIGHGRHLVLPQVQVAARKRIEIRRRFRHEMSILRGDIFDQYGNDLSYCSAVKNVLPFDAIAKTLIA